MWRMHLRMINKPINNTFLSNQIYKDIFYIFIFILEMIATDIESISSIDYEKFRTYFPSTISNETVNEFHSKPGKEHFRLLAYLSSLYKNSTIINIHTNNGYEALALSYEPTNTVYSFGSLERATNHTVRQCKNIQFHTDNILDPVVREKWRETILQSAFIFVDIEPHDGHHEYDLYQYLTNIGYKGFVIYDDIWYFKSMRNNCWYKIPDTCRYDLTEVGHWSGCGVVSFNDAIQFPKRDNSNWTLVTAYFNLTKCPDASAEICARDKNYYFSHAISTLSLPYNLVIYCDQESMTEIVKIRPAWFAEKTRYILREFDELRFVKNGSELPECFRDYRIKINENRKKHPYHFDNRNTASYYLFCMARYAMLKETILNNPFKSTHFAWINFCIERMGFNNLIRLDEGLAVNRDKFSTCYIDYIPESLVRNTHEYFQYGRCSMCSGYFTGNAIYMYQVCDLVENKFLHYLQLGYGHADEQLFSPVYFDHPELFEHYYGDYLQMITNYKYIYEAPEPPIYNFIRNSYNNGNYVKCLEGCLFVQRSVQLGKCVLSNEYTDNLTYYIESCKEHINKHDNIKIKLIE